jgi:hypothetical protein
LTSDLTSNFYLAQKYKIQDPFRDDDEDSVLVVTFLAHKNNVKDITLKVMLQEQVTKLKMGTIPRSMWITLEDDLVESCKPGDDAVIWLVLL